MIIKLKAPMKSDGWFIYDNAQDVFYSRHPQIGAFWNDTMGTAAERNVIAFDSENPHKQIGSFFEYVTGPDGQGWHITFHKGEVGTFEFFGDTEAYLLNDAGKTIERLF